MFSASRRPVPATLAALVLLIPARAHGQAASPEVGRLKTAYLADLVDLEKKFNALADAFPAATYGWRPMPGTRSVSQVLGLVAGEMYFDVVPAFGGKVPAGAAGLDAAKLEALTDRAAMIGHVKAAYQAARQAITQWSGPADAAIQFWGEKRNPVGLFTMLMADQHEHLGQLIAYARANKIVPPWSR
jgi:hypothetical protein